MCRAHAPAEPGLMNSGEQRELGWRPTGGRRLELRGRGLLGMQKSVGRAPPKGLARGPLCLFRSPGHQHLHCPQARPPPPGHCGGRSSPPFLQPHGPLLPLSLHTLCPSPSPVSHQGQAQGPHLRPGGPSPLSLGSAPNPPEILRVQSSKDGGPAAQGLSQTSWGVLVQGQSGRDAGVEWRLCPPSPSLP